MTKIVLIGAGSLQFGTGILGDIFTSYHLCDAEIVLNDINNVATKRTATVAREFMQAHNLEQTLHVESDLRFRIWIGKSLSNMVFLKSMVKMEGRVACSNPYVLFRQS